MARMRTIKPEFWTDDKVVELSLLGRLLFIGLWNFADDDGFIEYSPKRIKRLIFPDQDIDVNQGLDELIAAGFLCVCESDQGELLKICQFGVHQRPQHPVKTKFTGIIERNHDTSIVLMSPHEPSLGRVEESSVVNISFNNVEHDKDVKAKSEYSDDFESWWESYPRKQAKGDAWKAWKSVKKHLPDMDELVAVTVAYGESINDPQFLKMPGPWLRARRWEDAALQKPKDNYAGAAPGVVVWPQAPEGRRYAGDIIDDWNENDLD